MSPNYGRRERGCGVSANEYSCAHHVTWSPQINFGDLPPYLTYGKLNTYTVKKRLKVFPSLASLTKLSLAGNILIIPVQ
jgi:hypothetical protein